MANKRRVARRRPVPQARRKRSSIAKTPPKDPYGHDQMPSCLASREQSPGKTVHFGRNLIQGPSKTDPNSRQHSPARSALHTNDDARNAGPKSSVGHGADAQLQDDLRRAQEKLGKRKRGALGDVCKQDKKKARKAGKPKRVDSRQDEMPNTENANPSNVTDDFVCTKMGRLITMIQEFAEDFKAPARGDSVLRELFIPENEQVVRYIDYLALGGKNGRQGWCELLANDQARRALVMGIISRALKTHVFSDLYFGASDELAQTLSQMEEDQIDQDGFLRTRERAKIIGAKETAEKSRTGNLRKAKARLNCQLELLIRGLWVPGGEEAWRSRGKPAQLQAIIDEAVLVHHHLRKLPDVVFCWPPTYKDEEFAPSRMEVVNLTEMIDKSPYQKQDVEGFDRPILREGHEQESEAIVRVVCFPGLVAYRQGGGELARAQLSRKQSETHQVSADVRHSSKQIVRFDPISSTAVQGYRTRVICKAVVLLQWGKQTPLAKEAGTALHVDAMKSGSQKYQQDCEGFVDLYELFKQEVRPSVRAETPHEGSIFVRNISPLRAVWERALSPPKDDISLHPPSPRESSSSRSPLAGAGNAFCKVL